VCSLSHDSQHHDRALIIYDPDDVYFADELRGQVHHRLVEFGGIDVEDVKLREHPTEDDDTALRVDERPCNEGRATALLYAGRADQLITLVEDVDRRDAQACPAKKDGITIIAGPGALVALAEGRLKMADYIWLTLRFYSLRNRLPTEDVAQGDGRDRNAVESDQTTGYTGLQCSYTRVTGRHPASGNPRLQLPVAIDPEDRHNVGTTIYVCKTADRLCDDAGYPGTALRGAPGLSRVADGTRTRPGTRTSRSCARLPARSTARTGTAPSTRVRSASCRAPSPQRRIEPVLHLRPRLSPTAPFEQICVSGEDTDRRLASQRGADDD
jgi:hypothetical protein